MNRAESQFFNLYKKVPKYLNELCQKRHRSVMLILTNLKYLVSIMHSGNSSPAIFIIYYTNFNGLFYKMILFSRIISSEIFSTEFAKIKIYVFNVLHN